MAGRAPPVNTNAPTSSKSGLGPLEKLPSNTLKRNPKMELGRTDLLKLLSYMEGELQAREIVIATLKAERVKQLLYQAKYGQFSLNDPFSALQRDSYAAYNPSCDEASIKAMYNNQLSQVENLIVQHQKAQQRLRQHLRDAEQQHAKVVTDLEDEIHKHAQDSAQGDDVTYFLEKERDRLHQEVEMEREHNQKLEKELKKVVQAMEQDKLRHKQIVLLLLEDRKRIMGKLLDEHGRNEEMSRYLTIEKDRMAEVEEGLEEESKKSLVMEAELERQAANFSIEKEQLRRFFEAEVEKNRQLREQVATLTQELSQLRRKQQINPGSEAEGEIDLRHFDGEVNASNTNTATNTSSSTVAAQLPPPPTPPKSTSLQTKIASCTGETLPKLAPVRISKPVSPVPPIISPTSHTSTVVINTGGGNVNNSGPVSPTTTTHSSTIIRTLPSVTPSPTSPNQQKFGVGDADGSNGSGEKSVVRSVVTAITGVTNQASPQQVVQVTPRVNVSASSGTRVYTTTQGGKLTFHVTAPPQLPKKPPQLNVAGANAVSSGVVVSGGVGRGAPPPVPPNKPILPKKEAPVFVQHALVGGGTSSSSSSSSSSGSSATPVKIAATTTPGGGLKFGITISKQGNAVLTNSVNSNSSSSPSSATCVVMSSSSSNASVGGATVITATSAVSETTQQSPQMYKETQPVFVAAASDDVRYINRNGFLDPLRWSSETTTATNPMSPPPTLNDKDVEEDLAPALADFQQLLVSMATSSSTFSHTGATFNVTKCERMEADVAAKKVNGVDSSTSKRSTASSTQRIHRQTESTIKSDFESSEMVLETNQVAKCVNYTRNGETTAVNEDVSHSASAERVINRASNTTNISSTTGFNPKVRKVVSPTLPKSFNDLKL